MFYKRVYYSTLFTCEQIRGISYWADDDLVRLDITARFIRHWVVIKEKTCGRNFPRSSNYYNSLLIAIEMSNLKIAGSTLLLKSSLSLA